MKKKELTEEIKTIIKITDQRVKAISIDWIKFESGDRAIYEVIPKYKIEFYDD